MKQIAIALALLVVFVAVAFVLVWAPSRPAAKATATYIPLAKRLRWAYGNTDLKAVLIDEDGRASFVDATNRLSVTNIRAQLSGQKFAIAAIGPGGGVVLSDTEGRLYRYKAAERDLTRMASLPRGGNVLDLAFDDTHGVLWCAEDPTGDSGADDSLIALDATSGKVLCRKNHLDLGANGNLKVDPDTRAVFAPLGQSAMGYVWGRDLFVQAKSLNFSSEISAVCFYSGKVLAGLQSGEVYYVDPDSSEIRWKTPKNAGRVTGIALSGERAAVIHGGGNAFFGEGGLQIIDLKSGFVQSSLELGAYATALASLPDGSFAVGFEDGNVKIVGQDNSVRDAWNNGVDHSSVRYLGCRGNKLLIVQDTGVNEEVSVHHP